jgi:hypothetical protein
MGRFRDRRPAGLFRGNELARVMTMVVMMGVLVLLVGLARDERTWSWIAPGAPRNAPSSADGDKPSVPAPERTIAGPTDQDADEADAAGEEFQAVTDKSLLAKEEMPAYWRLMAWQQHQSLDQLRSRARADVSFRQLWQQPDAWRSKLVQIPLHINRTADVNDLAENELGLQSMHEVWGWNSDSQPYWYWLVVPELPPGMPKGDIQEEATFVGYFLKLLPYEDHRGKSLATPLLIGRLIWHPSAARSAESQAWSWEWLALGAVVLLLGARSALAIFRPARLRQRFAAESGRDPREVEDWLDAAQKGEAVHDHADEPPT